MFLILIASYLPSYFSHTGESHYNVADYLPDLTRSEISLSSDPFHRNGKPSYKSEHGK